MEVFGDDFTKVGKVFDNSACIDGKVTIWSSKSKFNLFILGTREVELCSSKSSKDRVEQFIHKL